MKLKHMKTQYTHIPEAGCTLYYAFGMQDGKMYESHYELQDTTFRMLNAFQIDELVTRELQAAVVEVPQEEMNRRRAEMEGESFNVLSDIRNPGGDHRNAGVLVLP